MKKIISFLLIVIMAVTFSYVAPVQCYAEVTVPASGQYNDTVSWSIDENYTLTIEGKGRVRDISSDYSNELYPYRNVIKKVIVKEGIRSIGEASFAEWKALEEVVLPNSLEVLEGRAFEKCIKLTSVNIPYRIVTIESACFSGCKSLKSIDLHEGMEWIDSDAFYGCSSIEELYIPDSVTYLGNMAFQYMTSLKKVHIPKGIKVLPQYLFQGCDGLETFEIPENIIHIASSVFADCNGLKYMIIPENVTSVGNKAFCRCKNLERVEFGPNITRVEDDVFKGCDHLQNVRFTGHYKNKMIYDHAFRNYYGKVYYPADDPTWKDALDHYYVDEENNELVNWVAEEPQEPPHQHKEEVISAVQPTNTTTGLTEGKKCSECGEILQEQKSIPAISKVTLYKNVNKTYTLTSGKAASWSITSGSKYASIKGTKLTVKAAGTVKVKDKKSGKIVTITIKNPTIKLSNTVKTMKKGTTITVTAKATPAATVKWSSSKKTVATVSAKGKVTAVKKGTATISAKANGVTKKFTVTVK